MHKRVIFTAVAAISAANSYAQSSVTLYGVFDSAVRFSTNQPTANGPRNVVSLDPGAFNGGRWGLRGTEDLGLGNKAVFALESGFNFDTGKSGQQGQLFGRQAWVGIANKTFGTVKVGRQYGSADWFHATVDPVETGNYSEVGWQTAVTGFRFDNTIDYTNEWGGLTINAQYSLGEQAGNASRGRTIQGYAMYTAGNLLFGGAAQTARDAQGRDMTVWTGGGTYTIGKFTLHSYYIDSRRDAGFLIGASGTTAPLANTSLMSNADTVAGPNTQTSERHDRIGVFGVTYQPSPSWRFIATYIRDNAAGVSRGASGSIQTGYFIADYYMSKRTDVYFEVDRSWLSAASVNDPNSPIGSFGGASNRTGIAVGMRHRF